MTDALVTPPPVTRQRGPLPSETAPYELILFVSGASRRGARAIIDVRQLCDARLAGQYELGVVDVYQHPDAMHDHGVVAVPALVKLRPAPRRILVGDLSDPVTVLQRLHIRLEHAPGADEDER